MNNTYGNSKDYAFAEHKETFIALSDIFRHRSIRFFLIGAQARDLHLFRQGIKPVRGTRDIDFAVMVESIGHYNELLAALTEKGFERTSDPYRLNWKQGETVIDLLPFGQIAQDYTVHFTERDIELCVLGYAELTEELEEHYLDKEQTFSLPVPPLHGIFLLKLLSWDDKKPDREKDLADLSLILDKYWNFVENEAYEQHQDLFDDDNFKGNRAAARILGRHLKGTLARSEVLGRRIIRILEEQAAAVDPPGPLLRYFASEQDQPIMTVRILLDEILAGISDERS